jgi:signal transduction histidine kinase
LTGPTRTRGLRGRLIVVVLGVVAVGVALAILAFNLVLRAQLDSDVNTVLRARATAEIGTLVTDNGRLAVGEAPDEAAGDPLVWVFSGSRVLERPLHPPASVDAAAARLVSLPTRRVDLESPAVRLLAEPVRSDGRQLGTLVVAASRAPYERTARTALISSLILGLALIVAVGLIARWLLGAALRPVARMTADAADWSEHDLDRRFSLGPPTDELTRLAATLDGLLDRVSAGMRREQRLSDELSHELRTPLAKVSTEAQLLAGSPELPDDLREEADGIVRAAGQMSEVIDLLMTGARARAGSAGDLADVADAARTVLDGIAPAAAESGVAFELSGGALRGGTVTAEPKLVERILAPLVENACRHARGRATVTIARRGPWVEVVVEDDGPGVPAGDETAVFEPGFRGNGGGSGSADVARHDGAGLGLSLARRLARSAGGEVEADASAPGGRFVVRLPAAEGAAARVVSPA